MSKMEQTPKGYKWIVERGLAGFEPFTQLQPWYFLAEEDKFVATDKWPSHKIKYGLLAFARRQDCDDIACFKLDEKPSDVIVIIHGWVGDSYEIVEYHENIWAWMKAVVDDIAEWSSR